MTEKLPPGPCSGWEGPGKTKLLGLHGPVGPDQAVCGGSGGLGKAIFFIKHLGGGCRNQQECLSNYPDSGWWPGLGGSRFASLSPFECFLLFLLAR